MNTSQFFRLGVISKHCDVLIRQLSKYSQGSLPVELISITRNEVEHLFYYPDIVSFVYDFSFPPEVDARVKNYTSGADIIAVLDERSPQLLERALKFEPLHVLDSELLELGQFNTVLKHLRKLHDVKSAGRGPSAHQSELELENRWFREAIEKSPTSVVMTELDGTIQYVNPAFCQASGYSREELIGQTPRLLRSGVHDHEFYKKMWQTILDGETWQGTICNRRKDGSLYWEKVVISPLNNGRGKPIRFIALRVDDMERRKAEEALRKADSLKSVQELAGGIAHEFSQPLQVLTMSLSLLNDEMQGNPSLERANRMTARIIGLVSNLKKIVRLKKQNYLNTTILNLEKSTKSTTLLEQETDVLE